MLRLMKENHLVCFDSKSQYIASYTFQLTKSSFSSIDLDSSFENELKRSFSVDFFIGRRFQYEWVSAYFDLEIQHEQHVQYGKIPFSIETFFELYKNPKLCKITLVPHNHLSTQLVIGKIIGKFIIRTRFSGNPFVPPVSCLTKTCDKNIKVIINILDRHQIVCSGEKKGIVKVRRAEIYERRQNEDISEGFEIYDFLVSQKIKLENVCIIKDRFKQNEIKINGKKILLMTPYKMNFKIIPNLSKTLLKTRLNSNNLIIFQNVQTIIQHASNIIFYPNSLTLDQNFLLTFLRPIIQPQWVIEGIIHHTNDLYNNHQCLEELTYLISKGEEIFPLCCQEYKFERVWKLKARYLYYVLVNMTSENLAQILIQKATDKKLTTDMVMKTIKKQFGVQDINTIYDYQFIKSTGMNKISYQYLLNSRQVKVFLSQKSIACGLFKEYNKFRVNLQNLYSIHSPIMSSIAKKNERNRQFCGQLAVPQLIKCVPYFVSKLNVQISKQVTFSIPLTEKTRQEHELKLDTGTRIKIDKNYFCFLNKTSTFPAIYEVVNLKEHTIQSLLSNQNLSEIDEFNILKTIPLHQYTFSEQILRILLDKMTVFPKSLAIRRMICSILPVLLNKFRNDTLWNEFLMLIKKFQFTSEESHLYLSSLISVAGNLQYCGEMSHFFTHFHQIFLNISRYYQSINDESYGLIHEQLFKSMCKWKSMYTFEILNEAKVLLEICLGQPRRFRKLAKVIIKNILPYLKQIDMKSRKEVICLEKVIEEHIKRDFYGQIRGFYFSFNILSKQKQLSPLDFLSSSFKDFQKIKSSHFYAYEYCLREFRIFLQTNIKKYGLEIQSQSLTENQNYFFAQHLWKNLTSKESQMNPRIRLEWIKIYKVFYFYFTPIITLVKLKKNRQTQQFKFTDKQTDQIVHNLIDFVPDIQWFSNYDSKIKEEKIIKISPPEENSSVIQIIQQRGVKSREKNVWKTILNQIIKEYETKKQQKFIKIVKKLKQISYKIKKTKKKINQNWIRDEITMIFDEYSEGNENGEKILNTFERAFDKIEKN